MPDFEFDRKVLCDRMRQCTGRWHSSLPGVFDIDNAEYVFNTIPGTLVKHFC